MAAGVGLQASGVCPETRPCSDLGVEEAAQNGAPGGSRLWPLPPGRGSGMSWAKVCGVFVPLSLPETTQSQAVEPGHTFISQLLPQRPGKMGVIAWPGARTGVGMIARWDLGRELTP